MIRSRLNFQGTTMTFSTERTDALWWLMISPDSNAVRALLELQDRADWREDVPRLVRGALGPPAARPLEHDRRQCVGRARDGEILRRLRVDAGDGRLGAPLRPGDEDHRLELARTAAERPVAASRSQFDWQPGKQPLTIDAHRHGPAVDDRACDGRPTARWRRCSRAIKITRTVTPVEQQQPGKWTRGDVARVRLEIEAQSDMSWVVVERPGAGRRDDSRQRARRPVADAHS